MAQFNFLSERGDHVTAGRFWMGDMGQRKEAECFSQRQVEHRLLKWKWNAMPCTKRDHEAIYSSYPPHPPTHYQACTIRTWNDAAHGGVKSTLISQYGTGASRIS